MSRRTLPRVCPVRGLEHGVEAEELRTEILKMLAVMLAGLARASDPERDKTMNTYRCWKPDYGHTEEDACSLDADSAVQAAERYAARRFAQDDYPGSQEITVRDADGATTVFVVDTATVPTFEARRVR